MGDYCLKGNKILSSGYPSARNRHATSNHRLDKGYDASADIFPDDNIRAVEARKRTKRSKETEPEEAQLSDPERSSAPESTSAGSSSVCETRLVQRTINEPRYDVEILSNPVAEHVVDQTSDETEKGLMTEVMGKLDLILSRLDLSETKAVSENTSRFVLIESLK